MKKREGKREKEQSCRIGESWKSWKKWLKVGGRKRMKTRNGGCNRFLIKLRINVQLRYESAQKSTRETNDEYTDGK